MLNKKITFILVAFSILTLKTHAEDPFDNIGKFFAGGTEDAEKLFESYMGPYFNAFGASLTGGWYNTAKPHNLGGFDITATFNTSIVPVSDRSFNVDKIGLESLKLAPNAEVMTPTIAGDRTEGSQLNYDFESMGVSGLSETKAFVMPKGTGVPVIPSPMLQAGIGLIKDTEINGRYMPTVSSHGLDLGMWGIGFKHGIKQWIPFMKKLPVLDLTLQYGYTKLNAKGGMYVTPSMINASDNTSTADWTTQELELATQSHTGNLLVSATLPVVCFYGGVGFATTKSDLALKGDFPVIDPSTASSDLSVTEDSYVTDPINMVLRNTDGSKTKPRYNVGVRFKFAVVTLNFDYTYANYSMASAGLGLSFR